MSKSNKRGGAADAIYANHLGGGGNGFKFNPVNNRTAMIENMYMRVLSELCMNRFKWTGLPKTVDVRFLEQTLFFNALSVFYDDPQYGYLSLRGAMNNYVNMMDNPTAFTVLGNNFQSKTVSVRKCVPIWANYMRVPDLDIVRIYANKLANLDRTVEINSQNARQSKVIVVGENQRLSAVNFNRQIDEGLNGIQVSQGLMDNVETKAFDLGVNPDTIEKVDIVRDRQWNKCMSLLGIDSANQDKKERLVASEVDANNDQTSAMRYVNLNARRIAADKINNMFGLSVRVDYYTEADKQAAEAADELSMSNDEEEVA